MNVNDVLLSNIMSPQYNANTFEEFAELLLANEEIPMDFENDDVQEMDIENEEIVEQDYRSDEELTQYCMSTPRSRFAGVRDISNVRRRLFEDFDDDSELDITLSDETNSLYDDREINQLNVRRRLFDISEGESENEEIVLGFLEY